MGAKKTKPKAIAKPRSVPKTPKPKPKPKPKKRASLKGRKFGPKETLNREKVSHTRPFIFSQELAVRICRYIKIGSSLETAAIACGVTRKTIGVWLARGQAARERFENGLDVDEVDLDFVEFIYMAEKAAATCEIRDLKIISKHSKAFWVAAAWRLERRNRKRWALNQVSDKDGEELNMVNKNVREVSDGELDDLIERSKRSLAQSSGRKALPPASEDIVG